MIGAQQNWSLTDWLHVDCREGRGPQWQKRLPVGQTVNAEGFQRREAARGIGP